MAENDACDGLGSNFSGAAFCLAIPVGGFLVALCHDLRPSSFYTLIGDSHPHITAGYDVTSSFRWTGNCN